MKKFLKFDKKQGNDELLVRGKGGVIGDIAQGEIFAKRIVLYPEDNTEWTSECLRQVADKLDELEEQ